MDHLLIANNALWDIILVNLQTHQSTNLFVKNVLIIVKAVNFKGLHSIVTVVKVHIFGIIAQMFVNHVT